MKEKVRDKDFYVTEIGLKDLFYRIDVHTVFDKELKLKGKDEKTTLDTFFHVIENLPKDDLIQPYKSVKERWEQIKKDWKRHFIYDEEKGLWKVDNEVKEFMEYVLDLFDEWTKEDRKREKEEFEKRRRENLEFVADLGFGYELVKHKILNNNPHIKTPEGKLVPIPASNKPFYLNTKGKAKTIEEAEKLVKEGKAKKYTAEELYRMAFPDEEEFYKRFYGMSKRMKKWIDTFYKNKGITARFTGWEERDENVKDLIKDAELIETFNNPFSPHPVEVYRLKDGTYALEYPVVYTDTFDIRTIIFKKRPTKQDFYEILSVEELEAKIKFHGYPEEFNCFECGRRTHFVEICANSIQDKISYWDDKYCGCC